MSVRTPRFGSEVRSEGWHPVHPPSTRLYPLETMDPPWFSGHPGQEDKYFYLKAQGLDWKTYVDLSTLVGHVLDARIIGAYDFLAHLLYENMLEEYHYDRDRSKDP